MTPPDVHTAWVLVGVVAVLLLVWAALGGWGGEDSDVMGGNMGQSQSAGQVAASPLELRGTVAAFYDNYGRQFFYDLGPDASIHDVLRRYLGQPVRVTIEPL